MVAELSKTHEQDVVAAKESIATLKSEYMKSLRLFIERDKNNQKQSNALFLDVQRDGCSYFNYIEEFVGNSDLLGAHENGRWVIGLAEDCSAALGTLIEHMKLLRNFTQAENPTLLNCIEPDETAYANMQRMVLEYLSKEHSKRLMENFKCNNLPTYGFNNRRLPVMNKKWQTILSFTFGTVFIVTILIIAMFYPNPTDFQYSIFRIVLSLAAGGVVAVFPGFIEVTFGKWLRAGGAIAVLVLVYFYAPAALEGKTAASSQSEVKTSSKMEEVNVSK